MSNRITFTRISDKQIERICPQCGTQLFVTVYRNDKQSFCGKDCVVAYRQEFMRGEKNPNFKGGNGYSRKEDGRVRIYAPEHPSADPCGLVYRYRLVAEKMIGRYLESFEVVHHKNEIPWDDRPENLEVMTNSEHVRLHNRLRREARLAAAAQLAA